MKCGKCRFIDDYAFCPHCGALSDACKKSRRGRCFIRADKILVMAMVLLVIGIATLGVLLFFRLPLLIVPAAALTAFGFVIVIQGKYIRAATALLEACPYCGKEFELPGNYCCRCGSKLR